MVRRFLTRKKSRAAVVQLWYGDLKKMWFYRAAEKSAKWLWCSDGAAMSVAMLQLWSGGIEILIFFIQISFLLGNMC